MIPASKIALAEFLEGAGYPVYEARDLWGNVFYAAHAFLPGDKVVQVDLDVLSLSSDPVRIMLAEIDAFVDP